MTFCKVMRIYQYLHLPRPKLVQLDQSFNFKIFSSFGSVRGLIWDCASSGAIFWSKFIYLQLFEKIFRTREIRKTEPLPPYVVSMKILIVFCCNFFEFFGGNTISVLDYISSGVPKPKNLIESTVWDLKAVDNLSLRQGAPGIQPVTQDLGGGGVGSIQMSCRIHRSHFPGFYQYPVTFLSVSPSIHHLPYVLPPTIYRHPSLPSFPSIPSGL